MVILKDGIFELGYISIICFMIHGIKSERELKPSLYLSGNKKVVTSEEITEHLKVI